MIVVFADDLSGSAEIGGICYRYGLRAELQTKFNPSVDSDVIVVDTDSRSIAPRKAYARLSGITSKCIDLRIFKKVDSVLRGNVLVELVAILETMGYSRALLVPANPSLGRTVSSGTYLINGQPLHKTDFANDPEFPAKTAKVKEILKGNSRYDRVDRWPIHVAALGDGLPRSGIILGEVSSSQDTRFWATKLEKGTIPAGAGEFFGSFLEFEGNQKQETIPVPQVVAGPELFVCGSTTASAHLFCTQNEKAGTPIFRMPIELLKLKDPSSDLIKNWARSVIRSMKNHRRVMVAIDRPVQQDDEFSLRLLDYLGQVVEIVLRRIPVGHLLVEGGATAASLAKRMNWHQMRVEYEYAPGVVRTEIIGSNTPYLTMKPGSYIWPEEISCP